MGINGLELWNASGNSGFDRWELALARKRFGGADDLKEDSLPW
jgi:hypothetical protein